jgi:predicted  nucleic acid-binding Zn ribbon protein
MGLYINNGKHPKVYKNKKKISEPNQKVVKRDYLSEVIDEQHQANVSLINAINEIKHRFLNQEVVQANNLDKIVNQLNEISTSNQKHTEYEELIIHLLKTQEELQKQLSEKINKQEEFQTGVLTRLDKQEALTEKIFRQLNHIRSILFERTNYLAGKIDEGYKITSTYVYNLMTGSDQPLTFYLMNNKKGEKQK